MAEIRTPRLGLKKYTSGTDLHPNRDAHNAEQDMLEQLVAISQQGALNVRPAAGKGGRLYWAAEPTSRLYYDDGTSWNEVNTTGGGGAGAAVVIAGSPTEGTSARAARADHTHAIPLVTGTANGAMSKEDKAKLDKASSTATASTLMMTDANGRFQAVSPIAAGDVATKAYVDTEAAKGALSAHNHSGANITSGIINPARTANATSSLDGLMPKADKAKLDAATANATGSTLVHRLSDGRISVGEPTSPGNAATKSYVDGLRAFVVDYLGTAENLDDFTTPGDFHQNQNVSAAGGTNYPSPVAGLLEVRAASSFVYQTYTCYSATRDVYWRGRYNTSWSTWSKAADTSTATGSTDGLMSKADKAKLDGATTNNTAGSIVTRSSAGRTNMGSIALASAPSTADDATRKDYVDGKTWDGSRITTGLINQARIANATATLNGLMSTTDKTKLDTSTSYSNPNSLALRNSLGQIQVGDPGSALQATNKQYVDNAVGGRVLQGGDLGSTNLNKLNTPGRYYTASTANVTTANNYPITGNAGTVDVRRFRSESSPSWVVQEYTQWLPFRKWGRGSNAATTGEGRGEWTEITTPMATSKVPGLLSSADKIKLDGASTYASNSTIAMRSAAGHLYANVFFGDAAQSTAANAMTRKDYVDGKKWAGADITSGIINPARIANATSSLDGLMPKADKTKLDAAANLGTGSTLMMRNAAGQVSIADPTHVNHAANKGYVDGKKWATADISSGVFSAARIPIATQTTHGAMPAIDKAKLDKASANPVASTLVMRTSGGFIGVNTPTSATHPTTKAYVDKIFAGGLASVEIVKANQPAFTRIVFPVGQFTKPPAVTLTAHSSFDLLTGVPTLTSVTNAGAIVWAARSTLGSVVISWNAISTD